MFRLTHTSSPVMKKYINEGYSIVSLKMGYPAFFKDEKGDMLRTSTVVKFEFNNNLLTVDTANSRYTFEPMLLPQETTARKKIRIFSRAI